MKTILSVALLSGLVFTSGCHAHKVDKVMVVKKPHKSKVILIDNDHKRRDYRIVHVKPAKKSVCTKHRKHWHCI